MLYRIINVALALALITCGPAKAETGVTDSEILVSSLSMTSGPAELYGQQTNIGIDAYLGAVNDAGGVFGRKIRCLHPDDKYDANTAIAIFNQALKQGVFGFVGLVGSPCMAKYVPMCAVNKIPAVGGYSAPNFTCEPPKRYVFASRPSYSAEGRMIVDKLWQEGHARKIAIIYQNDSFGADFLESARQALQNHGAEFAASASYTRNVDKVEDAVDRVKTANPDAVLIAAVYHPTAEILKIAKENNWHPLIALTSGSCIDAMLPEAGNSGDGYPMAEVAPAYSRNDLKGVAAYRASLAKYFPKEKPNFISLKGYIDAMILVEGLKRAGKNLTRENFVNVMERMNNVDLGMGKGMEVSYSPQDHWGVHKVFFVTTKDGVVVPLNSFQALAVKK